jgi:MSHA type pilus biogenesis protein MshL
MSRRATGRGLGAGLLTIVVSLTACAPALAPPPPPPPPPPAAAVSRPPLPELPVTRIEAEPARLEPRRLYSLSVRNAGVRDVLLAIAQRSDLNVVFGPDVDGAVTVDLKRVTLEEALEAILGPLNLVYRREGSFLRVARPEVETRIFTVSYPSTTRTGSASLSSTTGGSGTATSSGSTTVGAGGSLSTGSSSVSSADAVDVWGELERTLTTLLSKDGRLVISRTAGLVAVTDLPVHVRRVAQYLELVEGSAHRQVMIEAQIIEVTLSRDFAAGIDWSLIPRDLRISPFGKVRGELTDGAVIAQALAPAASIFQVGLAAELGSQTLRLLLNALNQQGDVAILSRPKISTLNNQKAVMKVATDEVFFTVTRTREATTGIVTETETAQVVTEGIVLDVTPQIGPDDTVTLNIRPSITDRVGQATSPSGSVVPVVAVRAADTVVRVPDGQTVIIGGLMQSRSSRTRAGVPVMEDVPVLGPVFRKRDDQDRKTELVILLTPTVLVGRRHGQLSPAELELLRQAGRVGGGR